MRKGHHDRISELFQTLESNRVAESTGVGPGIVRKCVESVGGAIPVVAEREHDASSTAPNPSSAPYRKSTFD